MTLYVFGDSFAQPYKGDFLWYALLREWLNVPLRNFGKNGEGPVVTLSKFNKITKEVDNAFFVIILSAPERLDYNFLPKGQTAPQFRETSKTEESKIVEMVDNLLEDEYQILNVKNVLFFKFISDYLKLKSKFFICTSFGFDEKFYSTHLKKISNDNFFVSDLCLDDISQQEFINWQVMNTLEEYNVFDFKDETKKYILDKRPNHLSRNNHLIFAQLVYEFFNLGAHIDVDEKIFKKEYLDENSEFMVDFTEKIKNKKTQFIYE